jgi:hypothetical protein
VTWRCAGEGAVHATARGPIPDAPLNPGLLLRRIREPLAPAQGRFGNSAHGWADGLNALCSVPLSLSPFPHHRLLPKPPTRVTSPLPPPISTTPSGDRVISEPFPTSAGSTVLGGW